jgi:hypothetical protein
MFHVKRAGQWRRIVVSGVGIAESPSNRTWVLDRPFDVEPDLGPGGSSLEIMPFRGHNIFHGDSYYDVGAFQFYGHAIENIVADNVGTRMTAMIEWGQWRGWTPSPLQAEGARDPSERDSDVRPRYASMPLGSPMPGVCVCVCVWSGGRPN